MRDRLRALRSVWRALDPDAYPPADRPTTPLRLLLTAGVAAVIAWEELDYLGRLARGLRTPADVRRPRGWR